MPTWKEVVEIYGVEIAEKIQQSGRLDGITCYMNEEGVAVIPQRDIDVALKAIRGEVLWVD
jgi:hypothetical protein